jgi:hypothetical protein
MRSAGVLDHHEAGILMIDLRPGDPAGVPMLVATKVRAEVSSQLSG